MSSDQDKPVELEQVPLKSDTDAPAGTTETFDEAFPPLPSQKKTWFFKKTKKTTIIENPKDEEKGCEEKPKKKCWWGKHKSEEEQRDDHISIGVDLVNRDEKGINEHVRFGFDDIFGEADTQHSWDCVWRLVFKVFTFTRLFVYRFCSLILGLPAAILFGILFAIVSVINVFACVPIAKLLSIPANWIAKTWSWLVHAIVDPLATALALLFSSFTIRKYGINSQPTDPCVA
ncbi:Caveolin [Teladorsagia circumcincta]|uniref:Caveolin n=1 Tax=Teladorsagia circumcincta TaxID=45464 RepID=A0A2G9UBZ2_TELCI|nr:Caveolin [Teladorsagia circumcincta]